MHRAWRPFTRICHFRTVEYSFIGRFETLHDDVTRLMAALQMGERERRVWQRANADTRPIVPYDNPDRLLKLHHLYYSDDSRDLVEIVRRKYSEDVELFGYRFPENATLAPWGHAVAAARRAANFSGRRLR